MRTVEDYLEQRQADKCGDNRYHPQSQYCSCRQWAEEREPMETLMCIDGITFAWSMVGISVIWVVTIFIIVCAMNIRPV